MKLTSEPGSLSDAAVILPECVFLCLLHSRPPEHIAFKIVVVAIAVPMNQQMGEDSPLNASVAPYQKLENSSSKCCLTRKYHGPSVDVYRFRFAAHRQK
jgi:hypothetical protein